MNKKIVVTNYQQFDDMADVRTNMKNLVALGNEDMDAHDGDHSFTELYEHRFTLYIGLLKQLAKQMVTPMSDDTADIPVYKIWKSKFHSDGSSYDGWFLLGLGEMPGNQISYHLPNRLWDEVNFAEAIEKAPTWDGHNANDVLIRIKNIK